MSTYDHRDIVRQHSVLRAGPMKFATYSVRDPVTAQFSIPQFHMTYDNTVLATLHQHDAETFAKFIRKGLADIDALPLAEGGPHGVHMRAFRPMTPFPMCPEDAEPGRPQFQFWRGAQVLAVLDGPETARFFANQVEWTLSGYVRPDELLGITEPRKGMVPGGAAEAADLAPNRPTPALGIGKAKLKVTPPVMTGGEEGVTRES